MIEIIATAAIAGTLGFLACAALTAGKVADQNGSWRDGYNTGFDDGVFDERAAHSDTNAAHARATDALNATKARIDRLKQIAGSQQSVKSGRIIAVLSGEGE